MQGPSPFPQALLDVLGTALSPDIDVGREMAKQLLGGNAAEIILLIAAAPEGTPVPTGARLRLPPLVAGVTWDQLADRLRHAASSAHPPGAASTRLPGNAGLAASRRARHAPATLPSVGSAVGPLE